MRTTGALCRNQTQQLESEHSRGISSATDKSTPLFFSLTVLATLAPPDYSEKGGKIESVPMFLGPKDQCLNLIQTLK